MQHVTLAQGSSNSLEKMFGTGPYWAPGATISYSYDSSMDALQQAFMDAAIAQWTAVVNVHFQRVASGGVVFRLANLDPGIGGQTDGLGTDVTLLEMSAYYYSSYMDLRNLGSFDATAGFGTAVHEIGHLLGLDHPGPYNGTSASIDDATYYEDTEGYSAMSYWSPDNPDTADWTAVDFEFFGAEPVTPMVLDIIMLQRQYGAVTSRTANDTYFFNAPVGSAFRVTTDDDIFAGTLLDGGGTDTIDLSGSSYDQAVDLRAPDLSGQRNTIGEYGTWNDVLGGSANLFIWYDAAIERIIGGSGADDFHARGGVNTTLTGGGGDDTIAGGTGDDTAVFAHSWLHYAISTAGGVYSVTDDSSSDSDGTDRVSGVESFIFAGQQVAAAAALNVAPAISGNSVLTGLGASSATSRTGNLLANASDANAALGDTLTVSQARSDTLGGGFLTISGAVQLIGQYGTLSLGADGAYTYALDVADPDTAALLSGTSAHDVFTFTVRDSKGLTADGELDVAIAGARNQSPVITSNGAGETAVITLKENFAGVTMVTSIDPENGPLTYALSGEDAAWFTLDTVTGVLSFKTGPDYEAPADAGADNTYTVVVTVSDGSLSDTQAIAVFVSNVTGVSITGDKAGNTINPAHAFAGQTPGVEEDRLDGRGGDDKLNGSAGNDTLIGGKGSDILNGAVGFDTFVLDAKLGASNIDRIKDFLHDIDVLALDDKIFGTIGPSLGKKEFYAAAGAGEAHDRNDRIVYDTTSGKLYYDDDGNKAGGHAAVHFAVLSSKPLLDHGDFVIV